MDEVRALALPLVPGGVLGGLQDVAPFRLQPGRRVFLRGQGRDRGRRAGDRYRHPAPERVQHPVGRVGAVQVVVEQPADRLPARRRWVVTLGAHGRVPADQVVEHELAARGRGQQMMVHLRVDGFLGLGERGAAQRRRGMQADLRGRAQPQPAEELLMARLQRTIGQFEGRHPVQHRHIRAGHPGRRPRQLRHQAAKPRRVVPGQPASRELDGEWQPPAQFHDRGHLGVVLRPAASRDPPEQRDRVVDGQHVQGQRPGIGQAGYPVPAGDQDQRPAACWQQRLDLVQHGGVVQDYHGAAPAELGPPQRGPLGERFGYLRGRSGEHLEQPTQRLGGVERRAPGIVAVEVQVEHAVQVLPGKDARGAYG